MLTSPLSRVAHGVRALYVLASAFAALAPPATASPLALDSLRSATATSFEVYAPTLPAVRAAVQELNQTATQFARYLGDRPPRIGVVIFESADQAKGFDYSPLRSKGIAVLAWVSPTAAAPAASGMKPTGAKPPDARPISARMAASEGREIPLSHAAAHLWFDVWARSAVAGANATGRSADRTEALRAAGEAAPLPDLSERHANSERVPDWFEEAVATLCEPPAAQTKRLDFMRRHLDARIPFAELFEMSDPFAAKLERTGVGSLAARTATFSVAIHRAPLYADESLALARYIAERESDRFIGNIATGLLEGKPVGQMIGTSQTLMPKSEVLEQGWVEWMQKPR